MLTVIMRMIEIIGIILIGVVVKVCRLIPDDADKSLSTLVIYITNPALIFYSVMNNEMSDSRIETLKYVCLAFLFYLVLILVGKLLRLMPMFGKIKKKHVEAMLVFTNMGFIGLPVIQSIYGTGAVFYLALIGIPFNILVYSYGVYLLREDSEKKLSWKQIINPSIIVAIVVLVFYFCQIPVPSFAMDFIEILGTMTVPLALIIVGFNLAKEPIGEIIKDKSMYLFVFVKLFLFPAVLWLVFRPFVSNTTLFGVLVIVAAMPVGSNVSMINREYGADRDSADIAKCTVMTTIFSIVSVPFWAALLAGI